MYSSESKFVRHDMILCYYVRKITANYHCKLPVILRCILISDMSKCEIVWVVEMMKYMNHSF